MGTSVPVMSGDAQFYVEVVETAEVATVGPADVLSFDHVRETVQAIAAQIDKVWREIKPAEATVEFGLKLTAKSGKLTGLVVEGGGDASLKVSMTWRRAAAD